MAAGIIEQQGRILSLINSKRWSQVDEVWNQLLEESPKPLSFHQPIVDKLARMQQHGDKLQQLYTRLLEKLLQDSHGESALEISEYILNTDDKQDWIRLFIGRSVRNAYVDSMGERIHQIIEQSALSDENVPVKRAFQKIQDMLGAAKGQVFMHRTWGLGVVKELDSAKGTVTLDFQTQKNKSMTLEGVRTFLQRIPKDHIHARMAVDQAELAESVKKAPAEVIRLVLRSFKGRVKVAEMKKLLTTRFLTEAEYKSFWNAARTAIKLDPWIEQVGAGVHAELVLRTEARTFFDEIVGQLLLAKTPDDRRDVLREVRRHGADAEMTSADSDSLYQLFIKPLNDGIISSTEDKFHHLLLFLEFFDLFEGREISLDIDELLKAPNVLDLLRSITVPDSRRQALEEVKKVYPDAWPEMFAEVILSTDPRTAAWMEKQLLDLGEEHFRDVAIENILAKPDANPELFVWAAKNILEGKWKHLGGAISRIMIVEEILSLVAELEGSFNDTDEEKANTAKSHANKLRALLNDGNSKYFKAAAKVCTVEEARRVLHTVRLHDALSRQLKDTLESILLNLHSDLRKASRSEEEEEKKKPSFHYVTRLALDHKRMELANLVNKEIPGMSSVIETAREHGDLRENAEYHAAKERQKLLMQHAAELEDLIARARVVEERDFLPDTSRFGTRLVLRDLATNETREITLMGMWEADVANNIISYLTPMGAQLLGHKAGDQIELNTQDGIRSKVEVVAVHSALAGSGELR